MNSLWIRRTAIAVGVLVLLLVVAATVLVATFDANRYKGLAIDWMKAERNRTLVIDGPVGLSVFPRIEITLSKVKLSEKGRADEFMAIDEGGLALELWPLLSKQLVIDRVHAKGVRVKLTRDAKGARNIDDLGGPPSAPSQPSSSAMRFDVSAVKLEDVRVSVRDDAAKLAGEAVVKSLSTGRLGNRAQSPVSLDASLAFTQPKLKGDLAGKTELSLDLDANSVRLSDMKLAWKGDAFDVRGIDVAVGGGVAWDGKALSASDLSLMLGATLGELKLAGSNLKVKTFRFDPDKQLLSLDALKLALAGQHGADPLELSLDWPQLEATSSTLKGSALSGSMSLAGANKIDGTFRSGAPVGNFDQLKLPAVALEWTGSTGPRSIKGKLTSNVTLRPKQKSAALDALVLQANLSEPNLQPLAISARGNASASATGAAWTLAGSLNENRFDINGNAAFGGAVPVVKAQAKFDALDLNRLLAPDKPAPAGPAKPATPIDFGALKTIDGQFGFSAGSFAFQQYRVADARVDATLDGGQLRIGKLAGRAWGGTIDASGLADAKGNRLAVKLAANGVNVNALLKDVAGKDLLEGTGRVSADVTTSGASIGDFRSRLAGTAALQLRDGAIKGYNLARGLRQAKAALSMKQDAVAQARQTEKTDFSELTATARIDNGIARSDDLELKSPFLRISGAGAFDIGRGRIDYIARATVTETSKGQDGAELAALKGVTVPVHLTGPFEAIDWKIQWSGVAAAAVENRLKDKLAERLGVKPADGAASAPVQSPRDAAKDKLKDKLLRGLMR